jgi:PAS domain S-box-containing protein
MRDATGLSRIAAFPASISRKASDSDEKHLIHGAKSKHFPGPADGGGMQPPQLHIIREEPARRRSDRALITVPVQVTGTDEAGEVFSEKTCTTAVSRYGCGISLPRALRPNEEVRISRLDNGDWQTGRVVGRMNVQSDYPLYGVEIVRPCDEFWGVHFSSSDERQRDALRDGMYFVDRERKITHWSEAAETVSGHTAADTVGKYCYNNILGHLDGKGTSLCTKGCPLASVMLDGQPLEVQMYMMHKDGHHLAVSVRAQAVFNSEGKIVGAVEMFHTQVADGADAAFVGTSLHGGPPSAHATQIQGSNLSIGPEDSGDSYPSVGTESAAGSSSPAGTSSNFFSL